jgi:inorganic triphosphatase YgiF
MTDESPRPSIEVERKYEVDDGTPVPTLYGFATDQRARIEDLAATYFDTDAGELAKLRVTLRRRIGGHDEGWHLKTPANAARNEYHSPLQELPPAALLAYLDGINDPELIEVAHINTTRTITYVSDHSGRHVAELADDVVSTIDVRSGVERRWREWEVELTTDAATNPAEGIALLDEIERSLLAAGARPSAYVSKLERATGSTSLE